jgi:hypothetical protein
MDFLEHETSFFRRTNTTVMVTPSFDDDEHGEIWFYKFNLDRTRVKSIIMNAVLLLSLSERARSIEINVGAINDEPADPRGLKVRIYSASMSSGAHLEEPEFSIIALRRYLDIAQELKLVTVEYSNRGLELTFLEPNS